MREEAVSLSWCAWLVTGSFALGLASDFSCGSKRWLDEVRLWVRFMNQLQKESKGVSNHVVENDPFSRADFFRCLRLNIMLILPWSAHRFIYFFLLSTTLSRERNVCLALPGMLPKPTEMRLSVNGYNNPDVATGLPGCFAVAEGTVVRKVQRECVLWKKGDVLGG